MPFSFRRDSDTRPSQKSSQMAPCVFRSIRTPTLRPFSSVTNWIPLMALRFSLARQFHFALVQFLLYPSHLVGLQIAGRADAPLVQGILPLADGFPQLALLLVDVAQVLMHRRVLGHGVQRFPQLLLGLGKLIQAEIDPAQAVEIRSIARFAVHRALDQVAGFG